MEAGIPRWFPPHVESLRFHLDGQPIPTGDHLWPTSCRSIASTFGRHSLTRSYFLASSVVSRSRSFESHRGSSRIIADLWISSSVPAPLRRARRFRGHPDPAPIDSRAAIRSSAATCESSFNVFRGSQRHTNAKIGFAQVLRILLAQSFLRSGSTAQARQRPTAGGRAGTAPRTLPLGK